MLRVLAHSHGETAEIPTGLRKKEQTKKVDSIQKDRIDVLKKGGVKQVQYFKGLFSSTNRKGKKKGQAATNICLRQ